VRPWQGGTHSTFFKVSLARLPPGRLGRKSQSYPESPQDQNQKTPHAKPRKANGSEALARGNSLHLFQGFARQAAAWKEAAAYRPGLRG